MTKLSYDLHIHSCLSPCGDEDMTPSNIVGMAKLKQLDVIAITDHNSCKNCPAIMRLAEQNQIIAIPAMELCTMEEVHVLCFFARLEDALRFNHYVDAKLIKFPNNEKIFGKQEIYDEEEQLIGTESNLLISATEVSFDELGTLMKEYHGVYVPAHLDKNTNSLLSNLGFIPSNSDFSVAELADISRWEDLLSKHPYLKECKLITSSDAHSLGMINEPVNYINCIGRSTEDILNALIYR